MRPRVIKAQFTEEELRSPSFTLPSTNLAPHFVKSGQYTWDLEPCIESQERIIRLSCSKCMKSYYSYWPIHTTNAKTHYEKKYSEGSPSHPEPDSSSVIVEEQLSPSNDDSVSVQRSPNTPRRFKQTQCHTRLADVLSNNDVYIDALFRYYVTNQSFKLSDCTEFPLKLREYYRTQFSYLKSRLAENESRFVVSINEWNMNRKSLAVANLRFFNDNFALESHTIGFEGFKNTGSCLAGFSSCKRLPRILDKLEIKYRIVAITKNETGPLRIKFGKSIDSFCRDLDSPNLRYDGENVGHALRFTTGTILDYTFFTPNTTATFEESLGRTMCQYPHHQIIMGKLKQLPHESQSITDGLRLHDYLHVCFKTEIKKMKGAR